MALFQILQFATAGPIAATPVTDGPLAEAPLGDKSGAPVINAGNSLAFSLTDSPLGSWHWFWPRLCTAKIDEVRKIN
jgi:hypothetical protein